MLEGRFSSTSEGLPIDHSSTIDIFDLSSPSESSVGNSPEVSTTPNLASPEDSYEEDGQSQALDTEARPNRVI